MKLTERQQRIISALYHQADLSYREIARQLGYQEYTVRREAERLGSEGIIRRQAFIDVYRLGYVQYELYLTLGAQGPKSIDKFLTFLLDSPRVAWIGQFSGPFQYVITVCCVNPSELQEFINQLGKTAGVALIDRQMSIRLSYTEFPLRSFMNDTPGPKRLSFGIPGKESIDLIDHRILYALSRYGELSNSELAYKLKIPISTCHLRIKRLESRGIIAGYTYVIDFSKIGLQAFTLLLKTRSHSFQLTSKLLSYCDQQKDFAFLSESIGAYDYKVGIHLLEPTKIVELAQRVSDLISEELVSCTCLTAFDYLKVNRYPFDKLN